MNRNYFKQPDGYRETIERGIAGVQTFRGGLTEGTLPREAALARLKTEIETADAIVIGAGAGLSTSAGFIYSGERFHSYFSDFAARFGIRDMYSGGFYPYPDAETRWAFWARNIYVNRYMDPFWQMTNDNKNAVYACLNYNEAVCPAQIEDRSIVIDGDSGAVIKQLL